MPFHEIVRSPAPKALRSVSKASAFGQHDAFRGAQYCFGRVCLEGLASRRTSDAISARNIRSMPLT